MKKRIIVFILSLMALVGTSHVFAQSPSSPSGQTQSKDKIDDLKERLATKVATLRQVQSAAIHGTVKSTTLTTVVIETDTKDVKIELTDDIRVYQMIKGKRTTLKTEDIDKNDRVVIFGELDTTLDVLKALIVFIQGELPKRITGKITAVDSKGFNLTVIDGKQTEYVVDFEKITKAFVWTKEKGLVKSGFSKMEVGDVLTVLGSPVPKKDNRISATKIVFVPKNPERLEAAPEKTSTSSAKHATTPAATSTAKAE